MRSVRVPAGHAPVVFVPRADVLRGWVADWQRWRTGPDALAGLARWSADPLLAGHTGSVPVLLAACGVDQRVPEELADARLAALVRFAVTGDLAAVRVVLERLVPTLAARAGERARRSDLSFGQLFDELTGAGWLVVRTYPLDAYPSLVALRMVSRTVYRAWGYRPVVERRSVLVEHPPELPARLDGQPWTLDEVSPAAELVDVLADSARAGVPEPALRLVADLGLAGLSPGEVARRDGVSDRAVRYRRAAAVAALRAGLLPSSAVRVAGSAA